MGGTRYVLIIKVKSITPGGGTLFCQIYQSVGSGWRYVLIIKVNSMTPGGGTLICKKV